MPKLLTQNKFYPLTVVIATLGGKALKETIDKLNQGEVIPSEILICIPEKESKRAEHLLTENIKVVVTKCRGQVAQRAFGFQQASNDYVLQLDDDVFVRRDCLKSLFNCISTNQKTAVGPKLYDVHTGEYHSFMTTCNNNKSWFNKLQFWVVNGNLGYEPGKISKSGINMGLPEEKRNWCDIDWLPGGCVLHRKENLILYDFYPFKGKAYAEDLYHSVLLKKNGIKLMRCDDAKCDIDFSSDIRFNFIRLLKVYYYYIRAMRKIRNQTCSSSIRLYCGLFLSFVSLAVNKLVVFLRRLHE